MCVLGVFSVWKRKKTCREAGKKANFRGEKKKKKKKSFLFVGCLGLFIALGVFFEVAALQGPPASKGPKMNGSWHPWKDLDFLFLKRHGSWKSKGWIESYGSWKFTVHRSARHLGFRNISAVLTPISTHEWSLEWEFDNLRNDVGFNPFWRPDKKLGFLGPPRVNFRSNLVKVTKNLLQAQVWVKLWKMLFCENLDLIWPSVKPRVDEGHFGHFHEKGTLGTLVPERVVPRHSRCSHDPVERKWYVFYFSGSNTQIKGEQNTISTLVIWLDFFMHFMICWDLAFF